MPDWFLKPHPKYGTTYRLINLVVGLQAVHDRGEPGQGADAGRGVRLRRRLELRLQGAVDAGAPVQASRSSREYEVPLNFRVGKYDVPLGIAPDLPGPLDLGGGQLPDQGGGDDQRRDLHGRASSRSSPLSERAHIKRTGKARRAPRAPRAVQPGHGRRDHARRRWGSPSPTASSSRSARRTTWRCSRSAWRRPTRRRPTSWS